jgi:hypothetical protein
VRPIALPGTATQVGGGDTNSDGRAALAFWVVTSYVDDTPNGSMAILHQAATGTLASTFPARP